MRANEHLYRREAKAHAKAVAGAPSVLSAARALLMTLDAITTEEFARGGERTERELLRLALEREESR